MVHASWQWRHNGRGGVSNHQPHDCLPNRLFRCRSNKTSKFRVTGLCVDNSLVTDNFPAQMASNAENVSIWWRHHVAVIGIVWWWQFCPCAYDYCTGMTSPVQVEHLWRIWVNVSRICHKWILQSRGQIPLYSFHGAFCNLNLDKQLPGIVNPSQKLPPFYKLKYNPESINFSLAKIKTTRQKHVKLYHSTLFMHGSFLFPID